MNIAVEPPQVADAQRKRISGPLFLLQVSRPGLWATTALFYLMPLGREFHWRSAGFWAGLVYILFPLGLLLYGVERHRGRRRRPLQSAQRHVHVRIARGNFSAQSAALADRGDPDSVSVFVSGVNRAEASYVAGRASPGGVRVQRAAVCLEGPSALRRSHPSQLSASLRSEQLAEQNASTSVAGFPVRRHVRYAFASFRRSHGYRALPEKRP